MLAAAVETQRAASPDRRCCMGDAARRVSTIGNKVVNNQERNGIAYGKHHVGVSSKKKKNACCVFPVVSVVYVVVQKKWRRACPVSTGGVREESKRYIIRHFLYRSYIVLIYFSYTSYIGNIRTI